MMVPPDVRERFEAKVQRGPGCWTWTASLDTDGYGRFGWEQGPTGRAPRVAYLLWRGQIPEGMQIDHLCRNRACVNPDHLEAVTLVENVMRGTGFAPRYKQQTSCIRGHPFDAQNTRVGRTGRRACRACHRMWAAQRRAKAKSP